MTCIQQIYGYTICFTHETVTIHQHQSVLTNSQMHIWFYLLKYSYNIQCNKVQHIHNYTVCTQAQAKTQQNNLMLNTRQRMNVLWVQQWEYFKELKHGMFDSMRRKWLEHSISYCNSPKCKEGKHSSLFDITSK